MHLAPFLVGARPTSSRRWLVAPRGRFAPPPLLTFCGGRSHPAGAPLPLGAASVAAALALLTPASGRLSLLYAGYPRRLALVPRLGSPALRVLGVLARLGCRSLGRCRSSAPYALRAPLPLCAPPRPLGSPASGCRSLRSLCACPRSSPAGGSRSLSVARGGAFHAPRGISPPVTKPKFYFRLPLKQACRPQQTKQVFCIIRVAQALL